MLLPSPFKLIVVILLTISFVTCEASAATNFKDGVEKKFKECRELCFGTDHSHDGYLGGLKRGLNSIHQLFLGEQIFGCSGGCYV